MCGTSTVGQTFQMPQTTAQTNTTQVAGEHGKGVGQTTQGGGGTDIAAALAEITKQIDALKQVLAGSSAVAGTSGGGAASTAQSMAGHADAKHGADGGGGCGAMGGAGGGCGGAGKDSPLDHDNGHGNDSKVDGDSGPGKGKDDSAVDGDTGPGKDGKVDGGGETEDPKQTEVDKAKAALEVAKKNATDTAAAVTTAEDKLKTAKADVPKAEKALGDADEAKVKAHADVREARKALEDARKAGGKYVTSAGDTWQSIADKYETTVEKLKAANPNVSPTQSGNKFAGGTEIKLPSGVGNETKVARAIEKLEAARTAAAAADKAVTDALAALTAARAARKAAKEAVEAAKKAADEAQKALEAAKKALEDAEKAAKAEGTEGGGNVEQKPVDKMKEELAAAKDKSFDERNAIFHTYFDKETDQAKKQELFIAFMETCSNEEKERVMRFLNAQQS